LVDAADPTVSAAEAGVLSRLARSRLLRGAAIGLAVAMLWQRPAAAAAEQVLRDAEIESDIRTLAAPIWRVAGLEPNGMGVYVINDSQLNSFVAGGQAVFINSGLIMRAETPNMLIGVIAHETGHIVGGHVLRSLEAMRNASIEAIIAMVVALGASIAGGNGAPMASALGVGQRSYLQFSVGQEATADHAALNFLDHACQSARGFLKFFELIQADEPLSAEPSDVWARTHPLTLARIDYVRHHIETARCSNAPEPAGFVDLLKRIHVKLHAFIDDPATTLRAYPDSDQSPDARYARAIAYYRIPKLDRALPIIDGLIRDFPNNPYYRELKGQMLFENGRIREAIGPYEDAVRLAPHSGLLRMSLSQVYIEAGDPALNKRAIAYLNDAAQTEGREGSLWRFLAIAYGRDNQLGMAALSLAEQALADGKKKDALQQSQRAKQLLAKNSAAYDRAEQIHREAEHIDD
jgi:predicted Zn-dependent protease